MLYFCDLKTESIRKFDIPEIYRSSLIGRIKSSLASTDPRKQNLEPALLDFGPVKFYLARHFGFCYGVENAIEISYRALEENPEKKVYLLSQMIHNPEVNNDLQGRGIQFIMDTDGKMLLNWDNINGEDIVIIPAFGTTVETEELLKKKGVKTERYNTTCPFVEKVWNRSKKLGDENYTVIIHGKAQHEETRATFSHSIQKGKSVIVKDIHEAQFLADVITDKRTNHEFYSFFENKYSSGFNSGEYAGR